MPRRITSKDSIYPGRVVTCIRPEEAFYSDYAGRPTQYFRPGMIGVVGATNVPCVNRAYIERNGTSDYACVDFIGQEGAPQRCGLYYNNIRLVEPPALETFLAEILRQASPRHEQDDNSFALGLQSEDGLQEYYFPRRFLVDGVRYHWKVIETSTTGTKIPIRCEVWGYAPDAPRGLESEWKISSGRATRTTIMSFLRQVYQRHYGVYPSAGVSRKKLDKEMQRHARHEYHYLVVNIVGAANPQSFSPFNPHQHRTLAGVDGLGQGHFIIWGELDQDSYKDVLYDARRARIEPPYCVHAQTSFGEFPHVQFYPFDYGHQKRNSPATYGPALRERRELTAQRV